MDARAKGDCAELLALAFLIKQGFSVAIPFGNQGGWDCLVDESGTWKRYQIKSVHRRGLNRRPEIDCRRTMRRSGERRKYVATDFDFLLAVDIEKHEFWRIPASVILNRRSKALMDDERWGPI